MASLAFPRACAQWSTLRVLSALDNKREEKVIGTHDGEFHCDECLAVGLLKLLPEFTQAAVVRTRDPAVLEQCDIIVDVGGLYDVKLRRFDHHQRGFEETMRELDRRTKLSSAGLTFKHYGREVLDAVLSARGGKNIPSVKKARMNLVETLYPRLYTTFIEHIDGIDNGQEAFYDAKGLRYEVSTTLSKRVGRLNPRWNEEGVDAHERFRSAVELCITEFLEHCADAIDSWLPARDIVMRALAQGGPIVELETYCPWQAHIFDLEAEAELTKYVLYRDSKGCWRVHAVPIQEGSFQSRLALPEPW